MAAHGCSERKTIALPSIAVKFLFLLAAQGEEQALCGGCEPSLLQLLLKVWQREF